MKPAPYGPFPYSPIIRRPRLTWPNGAHVALWVIPNIEFFSLHGEGAGGLRRSRRAARPTFRRGRRATTATASACSA